jgi:hypothetical protein
MYIMQCRHFCIEAHLLPKEQVIQCGDYLQGKAAKYFTTMVMLSETLFALEDFFKGLYNYCFPPDYWLKQHRRLDNLTQGSMTVKAFAAEVSLLFRVIGTSNEQQRVDKLWNDLRTELQTALWNEGLDFKEASWDEVVAVVTWHEMANMMERNCKEYNNKSRDHKDTSCSKGTSNCDSNKLTDRSSDGTKNGFKGNKYQKDGNTGKNDHHSSYNKSRDGQNKSHVNNNDIKGKASKSTNDSAEIWCYGCGKTGHIGCNCPNRQLVKSPGTKKGPPGACAFNVDLVTKTKEQLASITGPESMTKQPGKATTYYMSVESSMAGAVFNEATKAVSWDSGVRAMDVGDAVCILADEDRLGDQTQLGSPLCDVIQHSLNLTQPFPGDPVTEGMESKRFLVYEMDNGSHLAILDSVTLADELLPHSVAEAIKLVFRGPVT